MEFDNINENLISGKEKLAVVGLGYVGMPVAVEFAKHVNVIGFDIEEKRVEECCGGVNATDEGGKTFPKTMVDFTTDPARLREARFIVVAVPTPVCEDHAPDLRFIKSASRIVGKNLEPGSIVVFESTVYPGVTEEICVPIIEKESGLKCGTDWKIGYSPERINPGDWEHTLTNVCKIVSGMDEQTAWQIQKVYNIVCNGLGGGTFLASSIRTAEAIKVIENSQRDINIAFMNEIAVICNKLKIDTGEVIRGMNTKWNALGFEPGLVGGRCVGVDPYYLIHLAQVLGCGSRIMRAGREINEHMGEYIAKTAMWEMQKVGRMPQQATVVILGITFKENYSDIRNSKAVDIIMRLQQCGVTPVVADPWADEQAVWREYGIRMIPFAQLPKADCVIVAVGQDEFRSMNMVQIKKLFKQELMDSQKVLIDIKRIYCLDELKASGMCFWRL